MTRSPMSGQRLLLYLRKVLGKEWSRRVGTEWRGAAENRDEGGPTKEDKEAPAEIGAPADPAPEETPARPRRNRGGHQLFTEIKGMVGFHPFISFIRKIS